jgi:hypothetical protein
MGTKSITSSTAASAAGRRPSGGSTEAAVDLRFVGGLRAVSSIGVAVLHTYMLWQFFLPHATKYELTRSNMLVKAASAGDRNT